MSAAPPSRPAKNGISLRVQLSGGCWWRSALKLVRPEQRGASGAWVIAVGAHVNRSNRRAQRRVRGRRPRRRSGPATLGDRRSVAIVVRERVLRPCPRARASVALCRIAQAAWRAGHPFVSATPGTRTSPLMRPQLPRGTPTPEPLDSSQPCWEGVHPRMWRAQSHPATSVEAMAH
jgi:hypothetical protein